MSGDDGTRTYLNKTTANMEEPRKAIRTHFMILPILFNILPIVSCICVYEGLL